MEVKKFSSLLNQKLKQPYPLEVYTVANLTASKEKNISSNERFRATLDPHLTNLVEEISAVFRDELPIGLPPKRDIDHKIETDSSKPSHRASFQLSPAELMATKEYISGLLRTKKIRPS